VADSHHESSSSLSSLAQSGSNPHSLADASSHPFPNMTIYRLMNWLYTGSPEKTLEELDRLIHDVFLAPDFNVEDLREFCAEREAARWDEWKGVSERSLLIRNGGLSMWSLEY